MYKTFLPIFCLLGVTPLAGAQVLPHRGPAPNAARQEVRPAIRLTKEQFDHLRGLAIEILVRNYFEAQRARVEGTLPTPDQHTWALSGGFHDLTPDPNLQKYGALGPNVKYGLLGPLGEEQSAGQSANGGPNQGIVLNLPEGFTHPLDSLKLEGFTHTLDGLKLEGLKESEYASTDAAIDALYQLPRLVAASNQPPVPRSAAPGSSNTGGASAWAAVHPKSPDIRKVDTNSGDLIVRSNPKGYYVGLIREKQDEFLIKAKHEYTSDGHKVCWFLGDTLGTVKLHDVWVNCDGLEQKKERDVREATDSEVPKPGYQSRKHLEDTFASLVAPVLNPDKKGPKDAKDYVVVTQDTIFYGNYPLSQPANPDGSKPSPGTFSDELGKVLAAPCHAFKVRYFSNDGNAVVGRYVLIDPQTHEAVKGASKWGILPTANVSFPLREGQVPCNIVAP